MQTIDKSSKLLPRSEVRVSKFTTHTRPDVTALYQRYGGLVRARVRRFFSDDEADDVVQEVFVKVVEKVDTFRGESSPVTWLYQVTTRHCLNRIRDRSRRKVLWELNDGPWWSAPVSAADQEASALLKQVWRELDDETALIAIYHYLDGMGRDEIAPLVGCSPRTVSYRLEALRSRVRGSA